MPQVGVLLIVKHLTEKNPWIPFPSVPFYSSLLYSTRTLHSYHTYCTVQQSNTLRLIDSFSLFALNATTHSPLLALTPFTSMQSNPLQSIQFHSNSLLHLNLLFLLYPSMPYSSSVLIYAHVTLLTVKSTPFQKLHSECSMAYEWTYLHWSPIPIPVHPNPAFHSSNYSPPISAQSTSLNCIRDN